MHGSGGAGITLKSFDNRSEASGGNGGQGFIGSVR